MRVFVTGATGYIGGAVAAALSEAGHEVHALARTREAEAAVAARGWVPVRGDLADVSSLERLAWQHDAVVHAGKGAGAAAAAHDVAAVRAFLRGLAGSGRPLLYTSGIWVAGSGASEETSPARPASLVAWRGPLERELVAAAPSIRTVVIRPGVVYGRAGGIPGMLARGELPVIAPGTQRWPLVHVEDLAELYVLGLGAPAGAVLHGVSGSLGMRDLALLAAAGEFTPEEVTLEEARARFGAFADALALDQEPSSRATREVVRWQPRGPSPEEEFATGSYAAAPHRHVVTA